VPPTATPEPAADCDSPYTVKAGDWVWNIGRRCNIHPDSIIAANNLRWPYLLHPGDILVLPANAPPFPPE
jgi:LysM repeat protein